MQSALLVSSLLLVSASPLRAQTPDATQLAARLDSVMRGAESKGFSGVVRIGRGGRTLLERGYGMANLDYDIPNGPEMVYYIGSDSKQFTAATIGLLQLQGKLNVNDDIRKYVPEMPDYSKTYGVPVTIEN